MYTTSLLPHVSQLSLFHRVEKVYWGRHCSGCEYCLRQGEKEGRAGAGGSQGGRQG